MEKLGLRKVTVNLDDGEGCIALGSCRGFAHAQIGVAVDDNAMIRQALCQLFISEADFEVCGEADNEQQAIAKAQELRPDLIVMDLSMPVMNGIVATRYTARQSAGSALRRCRVILTSFPSQETQGSPS